MPRRRKGRGYPRARRLKSKARQYPEMLLAPGDYAVERGAGSGSKSRRRSSQWLEPHRAYEPNDSYFPFPKITFLVDQPTKLRCQICRATECEIRSDGMQPEDSDSTLSMMPCGHVAGSQCLGNWLISHPHCPFCSLSLRYPGCGHKIPSRPLTRMGVHLLPPTLDDGGVIPELCFECGKTNLLEQAELEFRRAKRNFEQARERYHESKYKSRAEEQALRMKREELETMLQDGFYLRHLTTWVKSW